LSILISFHPTAIRWAEIQAFLPSLYLLVKDVKEALQKNAEKEKGINAQFMLRTPNRSNHPKIKRQPPKAVQTLEELL
jgi:hypothetical protein